MNNKKVFSPSKHNNQKIWSELFNQDKSISSILNILALFSSIGLLSSFTIFYKYFSIHGLQPHTPDTFSIVMSSLLLVFYLFALYVIMMFGTIFSFYELRTVKNRDTIRKMWRYGLGRIIVFYFLLIIPSELHWIESTRTQTIYMLVLVSIFAITGYKYFNKTGEKNKFITLSFEFLFFIFPIMMLYLLAAHEKMESIYAIIFITIIILIIHSLPYIFVLEFPKKYIIKFLFISFTLVAVVSFIFSPKFFPEKIIQDLHMGNITYDELRISKKACDTINKLDNGYECKNNILKDILGIWILGESPIFQDKEKKLDKIKIMRNEIVTVL